MTKTILVVEDDSELRNFLVTLLNDNGYLVIAAEDGFKALKAIDKRDIDLTILDLGLPQLSGETVCTEIRKRVPDMPVLILSGRDQMSDKIAGFSLGADDYMTKPFHGEELLVRVKARLRLLSSDSEKLKVVDLELNNKTYVVERKSKAIHLSRKEFNLLQYLMMNQGRVLTRDMILQRVWMSTDNIEPRVVDIYIGYLRKKVDGDFAKKLIHTVRGFGYMIKG